MSYKLSNQDLKDIQEKLSSEEIIYLEKIKSLTLVIFLSRKKYLQTKLMPPHLFKLMKTLFYIEDI